MSEFPPPPPDPDRGSAVTAGSTPAPPAPPAGGQGQSPPVTPGPGDLTGGPEQDPVLTERFDDRERSLHPKVRITWRIFGTLGWLFPLGGLSVLGSFLLDGAWRWLPIAGSLVVMVLSATWYPGARFRRWRWRLTDLALELRYGVVVHRYEAVPYFRIQQIDIDRGPVDRLLGLATLQVTTASASGSGSLPGIAAEEAPLVRQELLLRAAEAIGDHTGDVNDAV